MPQIINTNMASLNAQRNLNSSQNALATALTRLSSGLRINSAKDDAAGLAISERFTTQIRGMNQAIRNANDGISLSQTGEGALGEVSNNLQRIRELAVQSANATNSASDRAALDLEVQQRLAEIDRISSQTNFNGRKILDGSFGNATFQVGADAGQTIALSLAGSTRVADIGAIASVTSAALGTNATGGTIDINPALSDYSVPGTLDGHLEIVASNRSFGDVGVTTLAAPTLANLSANAVEGHNIQPLVDDGSTTLNFAGTVGQFDVSDGVLNVGITLSADYTGNLAGLSAAINLQLGATASTVSSSVIDGQLVFKNSGGNLNTPVAITSVDVKMAASGMTAAAGNAGSANYGASFNVDGHAVTLNSNYTANIALLTSDIQADLNLAAPGTYTVANDGTNVTITNNLAGSVPVAITSRDLGTIEDLGLLVGDITSGTVNPLTNDAVFEIVATDGTGDQLATITLDQNYADYDLMAAAIQTQLNADADTAGKFTVTNNVGTISIIRNDASEVVTIQNANAIASAAGFFNQVGAVTTNATFDVDGATITLDQNYPDYDAMALDIASQLTGYTVTNNAGTLSITNDILGSAAVIISNADANAIAANITNATGTAGTGSGSLTLAAGDLSIAVGDGTAVPFVGTYDTARDLATAINRELNGIAAEITTDGKLKLLSTQQLTISGTEAGTGGIIGFDTLIIEPTVGDLSTANVTSVTDANETIVRIDAALTSVSNLRSTFGAIQNRFESTISNLTATAENMTASRSRIMDADFAMETANLTRAQILQQAGTAMLAQANQIPQNVLSLLG